MLIEIFPTAKNNYTQIALSVLLLPDKCFTDIFMGAVVTGSCFLFKAGSSDWDWPSSSPLWARKLLDVMALPSRYLRDQRLYKGKQLSGSCSLASEKGSHHWKPWQPGRNLNPAACPTSNNLSPSWDMLYSPFPPLHHQSLSHRPYHLRRKSPSNQTTSLTLHFGNWCVETFPRSQSWEQSSLSHVLCCHQHVLFDFSAALTPPSVL